MWVSDDYWVIAFCWYSVLLLFHTYINLDFLFSNHLNTLKKYCKVFREDPSLTLGILSEWVARWLSLYMQSHSIACGLDEWRMQFNLNFIQPNIWSMSSFMLTLSMKGTMFACSQLFYHACVLWDFALATIWGSLGLAGKVPLTSPSRLSDTIPMSNLWPVLKEWLANCLRYYRFLLLYFIAWFISFVKLFLYYVTFYV